MIIILHRQLKTLHQVKTQAEADQVDPLVFVVAPDLTAVAGVEPKYFKIAGDQVSEMTPAEKQAVDLAERKRQADRLDDASSYDRAIAITLRELANDHARTIIGLADAILQATDLADLQTRVAEGFQISTPTPAELKDRIESKIE